MSAAGPNVLGLCSTGHGAAAALVSARHGVRAQTLERFTGRKNSLLFMRRELSDIRSRGSEIDRGIDDALEYSFDGFPPAYHVEETLLPFVRHLLRGLPLGPDDIDLVVTADCHFAFNWSRIGRLLEYLFPNAELSRDLEHHAIHQWQAYLPSPFTRAAVLTADESGEGVGRHDDGKIAMTLAAAEGLSIHVLHEHLHPASSPGLLYAEFSRHLGFYAGEEGKTMGLAPYGRDVLYRRLRQRLELRRDGSFAFPQASEYLPSLAKHAPRRMLDAALRPEHADVAFAAQQLLEDIMVNAAAALERERPGVDALCIAGGVALNSCANQRIAASTGFKRLYIAPNPGDNGHALACALYGAHVLRGLPRATIRDDYLGPQLTEADVDAALERHGLDAVPVAAGRVAELLAGGRVLGLFQGGAEHGPRALGHRTILADPREAKMTLVVNAQVKHRELFRPFAPVVLLEHAEEWFDFEDGGEVESPYMLRVVRVRPQRRSQLGAVTHIDGTARIQTLRRETNPWLHEIVSAFAAITGVPVLLNTSFNLAKQPIVETPDDAIACYLGTGMDGLLLGPRLLVKERPATPAPAAVPRGLNEYERLVRHAGTA